MARLRQYATNAERQAAYRERQRRHGLPEVVRWLEDLVALGARFGCITADPPWSYGNKSTRGAANDHYHTMTLAELAALPVEKLAAPDCHLHVWATTPLLPEALDLLKAWGFAYRSKLVWDKDMMGMGNYWRVQTEDLLLGIRGKAKHFRDDGLRNLVRCKRSPSHSDKPDEAYHRIEQASPGPYLELFARRPRAGWTVMGDEIEHGLFG